MQLVRTEVCPVYSEERQTKEVTFQEHRFICCHVLTNLDHIIIKDLSIFKGGMPRWCYDCFHSPPAMLKVQMQSKKPCLVFDNQKNTF